MQLGIEPQAVIIMAAITQEVVRDVVLELTIMVVVPSVMLAVLVHTKMEPGPVAMVVLLVGHRLYRALVVSVPADSVQLDDTQPAQLGVVTIVLLEDTLIEVLVDAHIVLQVDTPPLLGMAHVPVALLARFKVSWPKPAAMFAELVHILLGGQHAVPPVQ